MKMSRRRIIWAAIALVLAVVGVFVITPIVRFMAFLRTLARTAKRGRDHLFFETDYEELLAACRELSRRVASGELDAGGCFFYSGKHDPQALSIPQSIRDIEPAIIWFDTYCKGDVTIELRPGPDWFGVVAYPEGQEGSGDIKLVDGLWYCDGDYREPYLEYMKWIDDRLEEGRRAREKRVSAQTQPATDKTCPRERGHGTQRLCRKMVCSTLAQKTRDCAGDLATGRQKPYLRPW